MRFQFLAVDSPQGRVAFLPFIRISLISAKKQLYPTDPVTLGEHLKKRRYELELFQKEAAARMEINEWTFLNWEHDRTEPPIRLWPRIINFLGYDPHCPPRTSGERVKAIRRNLGYSVKRLASLIDADESTVTKWERDQNAPSSDHWKRIGHLISNVRS